MSWIIYMHRCRDNGKVYVGKTCRSINKRANWNGTGYKQKGQWKFWGAIKKHGWDNFDHIVLEDGIKTSEEADEREMHYISLYDSFRNGYNATLGGDGAKGHIVSDEAKRKIGEKKIGNKNMLGKHHNEETKKRLSENHKGMHNSPRTEFKKGCNVGGNKFAKGHPSWNKGKHTPFYGTKRFGKDNVCSKAVLQFDLNGNFIREWESTSQIEREIGIDSSDVAMCCRGEYNKTHGYFWRYKGKDMIPFVNKEIKRKIIQMDDDMNTIKMFDSVANAERETNISHANIIRCCNGRVKHAGGYRWKYLQAD